MTALNSHINKQIEESQDGNSAPTIPEGDRASLSKVKPRLVQTNPETREQRVQDLGLNLSTTTSQFCSPGHFRVSVSVWYTLHGSPPTLKV